MHKQESFLFVGTSSGSREPSAGKQKILHLITPLGMSYEDSYEKAFPFDKMVEDTAHLIREALKREKRIAVIINNRAGGNGPLIAQQVAKRFLDLQG